MPLHLRNKSNEGLLRPITLEKLQTQEDNRFNKSVYENRFKIREDFENINTGNNENSARVKPVNFEDHEFEDQKVPVKDSRFVNNDNHSDSLISPVIPYFKYPKVTEVKGQAFLKLNKVNKNKMSSNSRHNDSHNQVERRSNQN